MSRAHRPTGPTLDVACWCGRKSVPVPTRLIGETTGSCGRPGCHDPKHPPTPSRPVTRRPARRGDRR